MVIIYSLLVISLSGKASNCMSREVERCLAKTQIVNILCEDFLYKVQKFAWHEEEG